MAQKSLWSYSAFPRKSAQFILVCIKFCKVVGQGYHCREWIHWKIKKNINLMNIFMTNLFKKFWKCQRICRITKCLLPAAKRNTWPYWSQSSMKSSWSESRGSARVSCCTALTLSSSPSRSVTPAIKIILKKITMESFTRCPRKNVPYKRREHC